MIRCRQEGRIASCSEASQPELARISSLSRKMPSFFGECVKVIGVLADIDPGLCNRPSVHAHNPPGYRSTIPEVDAEVYLFFRLRF